MQRSGNNVTGGWYNVFYDVKCSKCGLVDVVYKDKTQADAICRDHAKKRHNLLGASVYVTTRLKPGA